MLMNMIQPTPLRPNIQVDPDLHLSDAFAGRIVDQMLLALSMDSEAIAHAVNNALRENWRKLGNPKGQAKFTDALMKRLGSVLISYDLVSGKRKRFDLAFDICVPLNKQRNAPITRLGLVQFSLCGEGPSRPINPGYIVTCALTRHAMIRLVQRARCRTPEDLSSAITDAWSLVMLAVTSAEREKLPLPGFDHPGWLIPITKRNGPGNVFLVLKAGDPETDGKIVSVIATVLDETMLTNVNEPLEPLARLVKDINGKTFDYNDPTSRKRVYDAFEATANATRRGRDWS